MKWIDSYTINSNIGLAITYVGTPENISAAREEAEAHIQNGEPLNELFFLTTAVKHSLFAAAHRNDYRFEQEFITAGSSSEADINKMLIKVGLFLSANDLMGAYMAIDSPHLRDFFDDVIYETGEDHWDEVSRLSTEFWKEKLGLTE